MGSRGHTGLTGMLLGSVTQRLLRLTPCPLLVVPDSAALPAISQRESLATTAS
ncbi:MAG: universal stress protein [Gaiellales bacterium]